MKTITSVLSAVLAAFTNLFRHPPTHPTAPNKVSPAKVAVGTATWLTIAVTCVAGFEGFAAKPYVDRVGTGHPVTWCYGETPADTGGKAPPITATFTKAQCQQYLATDLVKYDAAVKKCIHVPLPPHREAALVSAAYNLGPAAVCNGSIARYLNAGNVTAGCNALLAYDHASGRVVEGLVRRRNAERVMCLRSD